MEQGLGMVLLLGGIILYCLPWIIAAHRKHHQTMAIAALNLLAGWSGILWIAALVWSLTEVHPSVKSV